MADIKDVSRAIQTALTEIGVNGELKVEMQGGFVAKPVGHPTGDDVEIAVMVADIEPDEQEARLAADQSGR